MQDWRLCQTFGGLECDQRRDAAVGYALPSLHPNVTKYKKKFNALLAARTSLWTACSVLTFSTGAWPRVSLWTTSVFEDKTLLEQTPKCAAWTDAVLVAD